MQYCTGGFKNGQVSAGQITRLRWSRSEAQ